MLNKNRYYRIIAASLLILSIMGGCSPKFGTSPRSALENSDKSTAEPSSPNLNENNNENIQNSDIDEPIPVETGSVSSGAVTEKETAVTPATSPSGTPTPTPTKAPEASAKASSQQPPAGLMSYISFPSYSASGRKPIPFKDSNDTIDRIKRDVVTIITLDSNGIPMSYGNGVSVLDGLFLTNFKILENGSAFRIVTYDGKVHEAGIVKYDKTKDLAIVKSKTRISSEMRSVWPLDSTDRTESYIAVGSPAGLPTAVSQGKIVGLHPRSDVYLISTSIPPIYGCSGGPVFSMAGLLMGVTSTQFDEGITSYVVSGESAYSWINELRSSSFSKVPVLDVDKVFNPANKKTIAEINSVVRARFSAYQKEKNLYYNIESIRFKEITSESAAAEISYSVVGSGSGIRDKVMLGSYSFKRQQGQWVISGSKDTFVSYLEGVLGDLEKNKSTVNALPWNHGVTDAISDPSRPVVYITEKSSRKVYAFDYTNGKTAEMAFELIPDKLALSGGKLYVTLLKTEDNNYWWNNPQSGAIAVVDTNSFKLLNQFDIDIDPYSIAVDQSGHIFISPGAGRPSNIKAYSQETGQFLGAASSHTVYDGNDIKLNSAMNKLYGFSAGSPADLYYHRLFEEGLFSVYKDSRYHGEPLYPMNNIFVLSPDDRYVFNGSGTVFSDTLEFVTYLDREFYSIASDKEHGRFYTGTDGYINGFNYSDFKRMDRYRTQGKAVKLFYENGRLVAVTLNSAGKYHIETIKTN